jgi:transposase
MNLTTIGIDLAKSVFQLHGIDDQGQVRLQRTLSRRQMARFFANLDPCLIGMEICGSAHHWARRLRGFGHTVKLISPQFVTPYRKGNKTDGNDAMAICEAVTRPDMRFIPIKTTEQQALLMVHRIRERLKSERTALINQVRGLLAEFGLVMPQGASALRRLLPGILEDAENELPPLARELFANLYQQLDFIDVQLQGYDQQIDAWAKNDSVCQRLLALEGIGPLTATAMVATVGDATVFKNGRQFAAWLGLTPREHSSGGKYKRFGISKRGDSYLRKLLVHGARSMMRLTPKRDDKKSRWIEQLRARHHDNVAACALAAKHARIIWAMMAKGTSYQLAR